MSNTDDKLNQAFELFDTYNRQDPNTFVWEGHQYPQEYFMALMLHEWILKLDPKAGEPLLLASRCQHIGRWEIPRNQYPRDREGYLRWRKDLAAHHAQISTDILQKVGYGDETIQQVEQIVLKKKIKVNNAVQTIENALCLVFLAYQYEQFYKEHTEKIVNILKKSLLKMDKTGHRFALELPYSSEGLKYIQEAVSSLKKGSNR
ncbi:DUF4202 domain-containing protein [Sphingobacterium sp. SGG-5]|uniref:DUF4202 domain-containing protein n=1 Tax=Sphingobacterium sp. SGG-5 TaxID=2710881 RepID=UPI0013EDF73A|nr:DUF4202 domain-containing protein [Sphingobacterium sp. SGG-5]NGM62706.1 DUF4202 domain-containing protein [Sphingobacterium sp. SGG-5]